MSSSSSSAKIPTVTYSTDGLYGTATSGRNNSFNATDFQKNLVNTTENGITSYLNQLINPTYDSTVFQAQTQQRNQLANQSFENNLINPLARRGLTRGSNVTQMSNSFAKTLADAETAAMATEDSRISNILSQLANYYQLPYNMMSSMQGLSQSAQSRLQSALNTYGSSGSSGSDGLWTALGTAGGAAVGGYFGGPVGMGIGANIGGQIGSSISDARLKENIKHIADVDGYSIYLFDYIQGPKNQVGVLAQEILDKSPEAVGLTPQGYYFVSYDLLPPAVLERIRSEQAALEMQEEAPHD